MSSFSPVHSVGSQIIEAIMLHQAVSRRDARDKAIDILKRVGVSSPAQRMDELSNQLSGGLRQRAMIAMALSCSPTLLIADEPTTALDVTTQTQILALLRQLQQEDGMAIMLITHDLGVVAEMATDVAVLSLGPVVDQAARWALSTPSAASSASDSDTDAAQGLPAAEALSDPEGLLQEDGGLRPRGGRRRLPQRRGRDAGPRRRERLRQDLHRALHPESDRA